MMRNPNYGKMKENHQTAWAPEITKRHLRIVWGDPAHKDGDLAALRGIDEKATRKGGRGVQLLYL